MDYIMKFTDWIWGWPMIGIITIIAIIISINLKFFQFKYFGFIMRNTFGKMFSKETSGEGTVSPFQAVSSALAATLGTGNIAGTAVAVSLGGPGAIFWMWIVAFLALIAKYAEVTLGVLYREKDEATGEFRGGFMWMLTNGIGRNWHWLAVVWAVLMAVEMALGPAVQSNAIAASINFSFGVKEIITGIICAIFVGIVLIGGIRRIGKVAETIVPIMAVVYVGSALFILITHASAIPSAFAAIFKSAFSGIAPVGGFAGSTITLAIRHGLARGVCSNEAGMGTAPFAHSAAITDHPAKQGLWGIFEVFVDTFIVCTATGLIILTSGVLKTGKIGADLTTQAFSIALPGNSGHLIVSISLAFFAFTTMLVNAYYGEICSAYAFGKKSVLFYRIIVCIAIIMGSFGGLKRVWGLMDTFMAFTVIINLIVILSLRKDIVKVTKDFLSKVNDKEEI